MTNGTTVIPKPDFYDGALPKEIDTTVREDLGQYIVPTGYSMAPVAPNFFLEVKAPKGSADVVKRQACYNGAIGARGMHQLQSYKQKESIYDGNAYTITSTFHTGNLRMYTTHPTQTEDGTTEYHMSQVDGWDLTGNPNSFRQGATAFRNARDYAREQRDAFISAANERSRSVHAELPSEYNDVSGPTGVQDTAYAHDNTYVLENSAVDSQYYRSQQDYPNEPSSFEASVYPHPIASYSSTLQSFNCNGYSNTYPIPETETSTYDPAHDTYAQPKASNKRRNMASETTVSKVLRKIDRKSKRRNDKGNFD